jgi:GNAT superfamily N-acetyltransferase
MANVIYREATSSDVPAMARIRAAEWETHEYWVRRISGYMAGELNPQQARPERTVIVAENDGEIVGFISGHLTRRFGCDGELEWINVAAPFRGTGIAPELLRRLAQWFGSQGAKKICVDPDERSRSFYVRHGARELNKHWLAWDDIGAVVPQGARSA